MSKLRRVKLVTKEEPSRRSRGQSLVEFALVGVLLFGLLMGIMDVGRLLFTYSVVSNAAQEGTRYGVVRPRDVLGPTDATAVASNLALTPTAERHAYITDQVVATDTDCNIIGKTRESAYGVTQSDVSVAAWYDKGDGTPIALPATTSTPYLEVAAIPGNRVVVEASYKFDFIVPYLSIFAPDGLTVKMRAARTIVSRGDDADNCQVNYTPAPSRTPTNTTTATGTATNTATATPVCGLRAGSACRVSPGGGWSDWRAYISVQSYLPLSDTVQVGLSGGTSYFNMTCDSVGNCSFDSASAGAGQARSNQSVTFVLITSRPYSCSPATYAVPLSGVSCGVTPSPTSTKTRTRTPGPTNTKTGTPTKTPTPTHTYTFTKTPTPTRTNTPTATNTPTRTYTPSNTPTNTRTYTPTKTYTPTFTNTATKTNTPTKTHTPTVTNTPTRTRTPIRRLVITISPLKPNGGNKPLDIRVDLTDDLGASIAGATVSGNASGPGGSWTGSLTDMGGGIYQICGAGSYNGSGGGNVTVTLSASKANYQPTSGTTTESVGNW